MAKAFFSVYPNEDKPNDILFRLESCLKELGFQMKYRDVGDSFVRCVLVNEECGDEVWLDDPISKDGELE